MKEGAIGLIDCLGFKGIWRRAQAEKIVEQLELARDEARNFLDQGIFQEFVAAGGTFQHAFLSDTFVVAASIGPNSPVNPVMKGFLIYSVGAVLQRVATKLINATPPIPVRGCIHWGEFFVKDTFIIGPAVDQAATTYEMAEGAFIWVSRESESFLHAFRNIFSFSTEKWTNEAVRQTLVAMVVSTDGQAPAEAFKRILDELPQATQDEMQPQLRQLIVGGLFLLFQNYHVPFKGGGHLRCMVVNSALASASPINPTLYLRYTEAMKSDMLDVMIKHDNTLRFLSHAEKPTEEYRKHWRQMIEELARKGKAA